MDLNGLVAEASAILDAAAEPFVAGHRADSAVRKKGNDFATQVDLEIERQVVAALEAATGIGVHGEEFGGTPIDSPWVWVLDPIDGTKNFANGLPLFGTMASVTVRGEVVAAAIHDPVRADTAFAIRGEGAWIESATGTKHQLQVAPAVPVDKMEAIVGTNFLPEPLRSEVNARLSRLGMTNWFRCAAHEYRLAAAGDIDALFYNKLMPWDHAAGWLLHREAGGYAAHHDGSAYRPAHRSGGLICTADRASYDAVRAALLG